MRLHSVADQLLQLIDALVPSSKAHARFLTDVRYKVTSMSVAWMICKLGTVLNVALRGQAKLRKNHTNPIVVAKALLGRDAVAVAVAVLILFRYRLNCCLTRPSKLYKLGAVAVAGCCCSCCCCCFCFCCCCCCYGYLSNGGGSRKL